MSAGPASAMPDPTGGASGRQRLGGVDNLRFLLAFAVIALHCLPTPAAGAAVPGWAYAIGTLCRGAVPFFFVTSGRFLRLGDTLRWREALQPAARLLPIYLFWLLVYQIAFSLIPPPYPHRFELSDLATGGYGFQLWFLPALIVSLCFAGVAVPLVGRPGALLVAAIVAGYGLWQVYALPGLPTAPPWLPRACSGPLLVLLGNGIGRRGWSVATPIGVLLVIAAWAGSLGENVVVAHLSGRPLTYNESTLSTIAFGCALLLLATSPRVAPGRLAVPHAGRLSLILYCVHVLFLWPLLHRIGAWSIPRSGLLFVAVASLSMIAALICLRVPWLRRVTS